MKIKGAIRPDPALANVNEWPQALVGSLEIVDAGESIDEAGTPDWATSRFFLGGEREKETFGFSFDGRVLVESGITIDEIDTGLMVRVYLRPDDGAFCAIAENGRLVKEQAYTAVRFERI
jgi:hypothetical protein